MKKVYCTTCKYAKFWEAYGGYCGCKCTKAYKLERDAIREWKVYRDAESRNVNNDCVDYEPNRWTRFIAWMKHQIDKTEQIRNTK